MKKKQFLFISCDEAKQICDKTQYQEASTWERLALKLRRCWCGVTKSYTKHNKKLTKNLKKANLNCLNATEKAKITTTFNKALTKKQ